LIGQTLSHYRVISALGAGGMGEVYRATDTNLHRDVAIKVLPPEVAQDPERLGRFKREAHLLAALNHPNIAAIYGLEEAHGKPFLALELVEGEDLKQRLARGAIPVAEALEIATQVAEALEEAHGKGIVHRDLKPANVKLTPEGRVKVLDFGLAKAWAGDTSGINSGSAGVSQSPTLAHTGTIAGVILGTAAYMSPEQARGKPVDKRADVWSFGVLLYEMLTGRSLFAGDTVTDVIAAVVTREPDLDALPGSTPRPVRRLLSRCLRKDPRTRLPDIGAARLELQETIAGTAPEAEAQSADVDASAATARGARRRERTAWVAVALVLAALATVLTLRRLDPAPEARPAAHFRLETPAGLAFWNYSPVALSPDGRHLVFVATAGTPPPGGGDSLPSGDRQLWIRPLDSPEARALAGTAGAMGGHFWSPDSTSIAFAAHGELRKVALASGSVQRVCVLPAGEFDGGTWSSNGTIVFAHGWPRSRLYSVPGSGGEPRPLTSHDESRGESNHIWPDFLPDGRHLLVDIASDTADHAGLHVISLDAPGQRRRIRPEAGRVQFVAPGYILFVQGGSVLAQRFDPERRMATGETVAVASGVAAFPEFPGWGWFSASATGRIAWLSGQASDVRLEWIDREGRSVGTLGEPGRYAQIALSPDDRRVAVEVADENGRFDLWVIDVARGVPARFTTDPGNERDPVWSPDSQELVFTSDASGDQNLVIKAMQGSQPAASLSGGIGHTSGERDIAESWSSAGNTLLFVTIGLEKTLWAAPMGGTGSPEPLLKGFAVDEAHVSADGRWLAYISQESGRFEVYVEPFRRRGERVRVSARGGGQPKWRGDGKELFYLSFDGALMSVTVREGSTGPEVGIPSVLVPSTTLRAVVQGPDYDDYAVSSDGKRFLVKRPIDESRGPRVHVVLDWPSLLP
jgi:eukaryotic-like serine/threonine-protein kinase